VLEGTSWYGAAATSGAPVYRLYSPITFEHLFTADSWEKSQVVANGTFRAEGNAWYQP
jgi:hypothetical protein